MQVHFFDYVYPGYRTCIPLWVREDLYHRGFEEIKTVESPDVCRGTLVSRFSFAIDVNEWGFRDPRHEAVCRVRRLPVIREIQNHPIWDEETEAQ